MTRTASVTVMNKNIVVPFPRDPLLNTSAVVKSYD